MAKLSYTENILKDEQIRIFGFRNRYVLVDSGNTVFMMFEKTQPDTTSTKVSSLVLLQKDFKFSLSSYTFAKKVAFPNIPMQDFEFICKSYIENVVEPRSTIPPIRKIEEIMFSYKISMDLAKYFSKLPDYTNLDKLYEDVQKAHEKLGNHKEFCYDLLHGSKEERKNVLKRLLPKGAYRTLELDTKGWRYLAALCEEIAKGYTISSTPSSKV